jgi:phosphoribosylanthranilate isomerase
VDDALWAAECGADAIGFVFAESRRRISVEDAVSIRRRLPPFVSVAGVFVEPDPAHAREIFELVGLDYIQYYGDDEKRLFLAGFHPAQVIQTVRVATETDLSAIEKSSAGFILLDTRVKGMAGGTGTTFDWSLAAKAKRYGRAIILAGGLNPDNVEEALRVASPEAVDVSSGV